VLCGWVAGCLVVAAWLEVLSWWSWFGAWLLWVVCVLMVEGCLGEAGRVVAVVGLQDRAGRRP